jgi:hypothetical protein
MMALLDCVVAVLAPDWNCSKTVIYDFRKGADGSQWNPLFVNSSCNR